MLGLIAKLVVFFFEDASDLRALQEHYEKAFFESERTVDLFRDFHLAIHFALLLCRG